MARVVRELVTDQQAKVIFTARETLLKELDKA